MANKTFNTISQLMKHLENEVVFSLGVVAEDVRKILRDYVQKATYESYDPFEYQRTYELLNCLDISDIKKVGNTYSFEIFFNSDKINMYDVDGFWNQHKSVFGYESWNGMKINELVPWFIENGTNGSVWDREGIYSIEYITNLLQKTHKHLKIIKNILKQKGYDVII